MRKKDKKRKNAQPKVFEKYLLIILIATLFMSVAYATVSNITLNISGTIQAKAKNGILISSVTEETKKGVISEEVKYYEGTTLSTSIELSSDINSTLTYKVSFLNNSESDYFFNGVTYIDEAYDNKNIEFSVDKEPYTVKITAGGTLTLNLTFKYKEGVIINKSQILNSMLKFNFDNEFIEFTLAKTKYSVPNGTTWEQFVNGEYNTYGFKIIDEIVYTSDNKAIYILEEPVKVDEVINNKAIYNYKPELELDKEKIVMAFKIGEEVIDFINVKLKNIELVEEEKEKIIWTSSNEAVVKVTGEGFKGTLNAIKEGDATITVSYGEITATCTIKVCLHESTTAYYKYNNYYHTKVETCNKCNEMIYNELQNHKYNSSRFCSHCGHKVDSYYGDDYYGDDYYGNEYY